MCLCPRQDSNLPHRLQERLDDVGCGWPMCGRPVRRVGRVHDVGATSASQLESVAVVVAAGEVALGGEVAGQVVVEGDQAVAPL